MKKILFLVLFSFVSLLTFSQSKFYSINKMTILSYVNEEWKEKETIVPENGFVIISGNKVTLINKNDKINFLTYGEKTATDYTTHIATYWNAYDDGGKNCVVMVKKWKEKDLSTINIIYSEEGLGIELIIFEQ